MKQGRKDTAAIRVVLEVDGNPVGSVSIELDRVWQILDLRRADGPQTEWLKNSEFEALLRSAVLNRFTQHLKSHLYEAFGQSLVKAELDIENLNLKAEAVVQAFGKTKREFEEALAEAGGSVAEFHAFLRGYLTGDGELVDPKKAWKSRLAARK